MSLTEPFQEHKGGHWGQHSDPEWGWGGGSWLSSAFPVSQAALAGTQVLGTARQVRLQPDGFPPLVAKAGQPNWFVRGHQRHLDSPPHAHPKGAAPLLLSQPPPFHVLPLLSPRSYSLGGRKGGSPARLVQALGPFALILEHLGCHPTHAIPKLPSPLPPALRRCWPPGPWGLSSGSSQQPNANEASHSL